MNKLFRFTYQLIFLIFWLPALPAIAQEPIPVEPIFPSETLEPLYPDSIMVMQEIHPDSVVMTVDQDSDVGFIIPLTMAQEYMRMLKVQVPLQEDLIEHYAKQAKMLKKLNKNLSLQLEMSAFQSTLTDTLFQTLQNYRALKTESDELESSYQGEIRKLEAQLAEQKNQLRQLELERGFEGEKTMAVSQGLDEMEKIAKSKKKWKTRATFLAATTVILSAIIVMK